MVAHTWQVLHAPTADHHDGVLLKIMALTRDVADNLVAVGKSHLSDLAQRRVWLLRSRRIDPRTDATLLRIRLERRHLVAPRLVRPRLSDQLLDRRHSRPSRLFLPPTRNGAARAASFRRALHDSGSQG